MEKVRTTTQSGRKRRFGERNEERNAVYRTTYLTGHTSRNEPNVGVRDAIKIACDSEDTVTLIPSASGAGGHNVAATS